jgi:DNA-binding NtrC family response regulator
MPRWPKKPAPPPVDPAHAHIVALARRCAEAGFTLRSALSLFDALILADALYLERGNQGAAAKRLGVSRRHFIRTQNRSLLSETGDQGDPS